MELTPEELSVLWAIEEGMSDLEAAFIYTGIEKDKLKPVYEKLEQLGLIKVTKKFDPFYKEDYWDAVTTKRAKKQLNKKPTKEKKKSAPKKYSLWLMPIGEDYNKLHNIILQLSKKHNAPAFEPHVTLIGTLEGDEAGILEKTEKLAAVISQYKIELAKVEYLNQYFRCLFIKVNETSDVMNASIKANEIFNVKDDRKYMPHLSLMYGDFPPEQKEEIIKEIGQEFQSSFEISSIHLFSTAGNPEKWNRVKEFQLKEKEQSQV